MSNLNFISEMISRKNLPPEADAILPNNGLHASAVVAAVRCKGQEDGDNFQVAWVAIIIFSRHLPSLM
jgi:hypothetical protein